MQLNLLGHSQLAVQHGGEGIAVASPSLDLEDQRAVAALGPELDLSRLEVAALVPLLALVVVIGVAPAWVLDVIDAATGALVGR